MDLHTLQVSSAITNVTCGIILSAACLVRREPGAVGWWAAAFFCFAGGLLMQVVEQRHPVIAALTYGLLVGGAVLMLAGFRAFDGVRPVTRVMLLLLVAPPALSLWLALAYPGAAWTELAVFLASCLATTAVPIYIFRHNRERLAFRWGAGSVFTVQILVTVGVVLCGASIVTPASVTLAISLTDQVCSTIAVACVLGMMMERDNRRLDRLARRDALTGCLNRAGLMDYGATATGPHGILVIDLDRFKQLNDQFGHAAGDEVLRAFVHRAERTLPPTAVLARFGGEEFVALLPGATLEDARGAAMELVAAVRAAGVPCDGRSIPFTVSVGVAAVSADEAILAGIKTADAALYRAKRGGRDRVVVAESRPSSTRGSLTVAA